MMKIFAFVFFLPIFAAAQIHLVHVPSFPVDRETGLITFKDTGKMDGIKKEALFGALKKWCTSAAKPQDALNTNQGDGWIYLDYTASLDESYTMHDNRNNITNAPFTIYFKLQLAVSDGVYMITMRNFKIQAFDDKWPLEELCKRVVLRVTFEYMPFIYDVGNMQGYILNEVKNDATGMTKDANKYLLKEHKKGRL